MNFALQNPFGLALMLPLAAAIIVMYILRMRRKDVRVPATFLWPARTDEIRANALFQRLRFSWLLVLQLLALAALVFSLARPQTKQYGLTGEVTVLVVDASASMGATDVKPSRFEDARRQVVEAIRSARPGDRLAVIEAGPTPRVVFPLGNDPARQLRALESLTRTDAESDTGEALRLASALVGSQEGARIVLLSDGVFPRVENFSAGKAAFVYRSIGNSDANVAVTALGTTEGAGGRTAFVGLQNNSLKPQAGTLTLLADGQTLDSVKVNLASNAKWGRTLTVPSGTTLLEAKLDAGDILAADDYAATVANPAASLRVLVVGKSDIFLERALSLDPRVTLDRAATLPDNAKGSGAGPYDIVVFSGIPSESVRGRGILVFGPAGGQTLAKGDTTVKNPTFLVGSDSPLLDSVTFRDVYLDKVTKVTPVGSAKVVAQTTAGPLVINGSRSGQRQVYVAFEPIQSDFPLQTSFPIFIGNALTYLAGEATSDTLAVRAGAPFSLPGTKSGTLVSPDNAKVALKSTNGTLIVREAHTVGRYALEADGRKLTVAATLQSGSESNLGPRAELVLGGGAVKAVQAPARFADFWRPLVVLCLLLLIAEWALFVRKS